jgi:hypothetical protein
VLLGIVLVGLLAGTAQAEDEFTTVGLPTTSPFTGPMVASLEPVAEAYWAQRGVQLPEPVEVFVMADEPGIGARAEQPGHKVWLTESLLAERRLNGRSFLCMTYLHERGHNAGLAHGSGDPIMATDPWLGMTEVVPKCFKWAEWGWKGLTHYVP